MSSDFTKHAQETSGGTLFRLLSGPEISGQEFGDMSGTVDYLVRTAEVTRFLRDVMPVPRRRAANEPIVVLPRTQVPYLPTLFYPTSFEVCGQKRSEKPLDPFMMRPAATGPDANKAFDELAIVTLHFSTARESFISPDFPQLQSDRPHEFLEHQFSVNAEVLSVNPNSNTKVTESESGQDAKPIKDLAAPIIYLLPVIEHTCTWRWAIDPDFDRIFAAIGTVNQSSVTFLQGAPPGTALFLGIAGKLGHTWNFSGPASQQNARTLPPSYQEIWQLDYKFARRKSRDGDKPITWNHILDPEDQKWKYLFRKNGDKLYSETNFVELFRATVAAAA